MTQLRRSLAWSAAQSYLGVALQLLSTMVLSRVLTPAEVGTFAVATVFAALASNFRDFGVAEYLIQAKELTHRQIRAAFAVNIGVSWAMALALVLGAGLAGQFYREPGISEVMRIQALNFVLIPFGAINMAWYRREMNFKPMFMAGVLSDVIGLVVAITLALRGHGALSLAWSSFAGVVVTWLVSVSFRPRDFPRWPGLAGIREVLHFGGFASGIYLLGQLGRNAPELVIGRVQDVSAVAMFSRGGGLVQLFRQLVVRAIMPVCLPYFAQSVRDEGSVNRAYGRGVAIFTVIGWTFLGFLALAAWPSIRVVYGDQWLEAVPLAQLLCLAAAFEIVHYLAKEALLAHGQVKAASRLQAELQGVQLVGLLGVLPWGLTGACVGLIAAQAIGLVLSQRALRQGTGYTLGELLAPCRASAPVALIALAPMGALVLAWPATASNYLGQLAVGGLLTTAAWLLALQRTGHPLWAEIARLIVPLRRRFGGRSADTPEPSDGAPH